MLQNQIRSDLSKNGYYVASGINFNILSNGSSVWGSQASLRTDASGTSYTHSGANIFIQSNATTYIIPGGAYAVDLGVINAGQSINLQYTLSTSANGHAPGAGYFTVPAQTVDVPDGSGGYGGYGGHWETVTVPAYTEVKPAHTVTTPAYTSNGEGSGSHASSGDPFDIAWDGSPSSLYDATGHFAKPPAHAFNITMSAVPEPGALALAMGGVAVAGALARRRRTPQA